MAIQQTDQRLFKGTTAEILAFSPPAFTGWTYAESTTDHSAYRWNSTTSLWEPFGSAALLTGLLSNDVATAPGDPIGTRPLANSQSVGTWFAALDSSSLSVVIPHPKTAGQKVWRATASTARTYRGTASGAGATQFRMGVYVPGTGIFTQAATVGQFCNAVASSTVGGGASMLVSLGPCLITLVTPGVGGLTGGVEFQSDGAGQAIVYTPGVGIVPLGIAPATINAGDIQTLVFYDY